MYEFFNNTTMKKKIFYSLLICAASCVCTNGKRNLRKYTKLVFQDEFNGTGLPDKSKWDFENGHLRNSEKQYYTTDRLENAYQKDGYLHLVARNDSTLIDGKVRPITSASIHTKIPSP